MASMAKSAPRTPISAAHRRAAAVGSTPSSATATASGGGGTRFIDAKVATRNAFIALAGGSKVDVYVRIRPLSAAEAAAEPDAPPRVVALEDGARVALHAPPGAGRGSNDTLEQFSYDGVFGTDSTQADVYATVLARQVDQTVRGQPSCVFAYGQTGSGKTHTAFGDLSKPELYGLLPRAAEALFAGLNAKHGAGAEALASKAGVAAPGTRPFVRLSILEVYNEELSDLLFPTGPGIERAANSDPAEPLVVPFEDAMKILRAELASSAATLSARDDREKRRRERTPLSPNTGGAATSATADALGARAVPLSIVDHPARGTLVLNLVQVEVTNTSQVVALLAVAQERSHWAETAMNMQSNRAHRIVTFSAGTYHGGSGGGEQSAEMLADLRIVDLAGSEDTNRSLAAGSTKAEASYINKSLLALGRVVTALAARSPHIPYRESKLTRLLSEALGGVCKTTFVCCVSPAASSIVETASTLRYAKRAADALNITALPKSQQDELVMSGMMRRLDEMEAAAAEAEASHAATVSALERALAASQGEVGTLSDALTRTTAHVTALREQSLAASAALSVVSLRADRLEARVHSTTAELASAVRARDGLSADRTSLVNVLSGVRSTRDVLLREASVVEANLAEECAGLSNTLSCAATEATALHGEVLRKRAVAAGAESSVDSLAHDMGLAVRRLLDSTLTFRLEQAAQHEDAAAALTAITHERAAHAGAVGADVRRLSRSLTDVMAGLADACAQADVEARARSLRTREEGWATADAASAALGALREAVEVAVAGGRALAVQLDESLSSWLTRSSARIEAIAAASEAFAVRVSGEAGSLASLLQASAAQAASHAESHVASLEAFREAEREAVAAAGEHLIAELSSHLARAVGEMTAAASARGDKASASLRTEAATAAAAGAVGAKRAASVVSALVSGAEAHGRSTNGEAARAKATSASSAVAASGLISSLKTSLDALNADVGSRVSAATSRWSAFAKDHSEALTSGDAAGAAHVTAVATRATEATAAAASATDALTTSVSSAAAAHAVDASALRAALAELGAHMGAASDEALAGLHAAGSTVSAFAAAYPREEAPEPVLGSYPIPPPPARLAPLAAVVKSAVERGTTGAAGAAASASLEDAWAREEDVRNGIKQPGQGTDFAGLLGPVVVPPPAAAAQRSSSGGAGASPASFSHADLASLDDDALKEAAAAAMGDILVRAKATDEASRELLVALKDFSSSAV